MAIASKLDEINVNEMIRAKTVRLISDDGEQVGQDFPPSAS